MCARSHEILATNGDWGPWSAQTAVGLDCQRKRSAAKSLDLPIQTWTPLDGSGPVAIGIWPKGGHLPRQSQGLARAPHSRQEHEEGRSQERKGPSSHPSTRKDRRPSRAEESGSNARSHEHDTAKRDDHTRTHTDAHTYHRQSHQHATWVQVVTRVSELSALQRICSLDAVFSDAGVIDPPSASAVR